MSQVLYKTRCYLVGHMQYQDGQEWRTKAEAKLNPRNIVTFNPYKKPFIKDLDESNEQRKVWDSMIEKENYDELSEQFKKVRIYDLNLVDRSDFIVAHIIPNVASWGSAEELAVANRMKKPTFISVEGGKKKTPLWMFGMFPHKYFYDSIDQLLDKICQIDDGEIEIDSDRWRLLATELR